MRFSYYPGCSLQATGRAYDESTRAVAAALGIELVELDDWNCCGATTYMSVREQLSLSISARNLCLAERQGLPLVAPCSACFTVLRKTDHHLAESPELRRDVGRVLEAAGLSHTPGRVAVHHLLEVFFMGSALERLEGAVQRPLRGLRVAPYYGCQVVRPRVEFDHPELPTSLDRLMGAVGAEVVYFPAKTRCCGASLVASNEAAAFRLCRNLLICAQQNRADCIVTVCPLCQINLDSFQSRVNAAYGTSFHIPILYVTQLMGLALGLGSEALGLGREIVAAGPVLEPFCRGRAAATAVQ